MLKSLAVCVSLLGACAAHATSTTVTFALADNYPPLMTETGGIAGAIIDEVNNRLGDEFHIEVESAPWQRMVAMVENGQAHGLVGTYYRPDVRPWIDPYSTPLLGDPISLFCRSGVADASWSYPQDFAGLTFGYLIGSYAAGAEFQEMVAAGEIDIDEGASIEVNVRKLAAGRIDCFVEGGLPIQVEIAAAGAGADIEHVADISVEDFYVGFQSDWATTGNAPEFIAAFNATIEEMQADGTIDRLIEEGLN